MNYRTDIRNDWSKTITFAIIVLVLEFIGAMALTVGKGFEDASFTDRFIIYVIFAVIGVGFILFVQAKNSSSKKRVFLVPLHEPEEALGVGKLKVFKNPVLLFLLALVVFIPILLISAKYSNTFFSGIPFRNQQVSTFANIWGDSGFPALSENFLMYIPIVLLLSANFLLFYRVKVLYWFNNIVSIPLIMAFVWKWFHNLVYGSDEFSSFYTMAFGYIGVLLTLITMSAILWFVIHFLSNFMLSAKYSGLLANDSFIIILVFVWVATVLLLFGLNYVWKDHNSLRG